MRRLLLASAAFAFGLLATSEARACSPWIATDAATGETWGSGSPEAYRREQAEWRARSDAVVIAQAHAGRMIDGRDVEFALAPRATVYGAPLPEGDLAFRWQPGNTCNSFELNLTDLVIVYAAQGPSGWTVVGVTVPGQLQDRPPGFSMLVRNVHRGLIPAPPFRAD